MAVLGSFSIRKNIINKELNMKITGSFDQKMVQDFIKDYQSKVAGIDASEYTLKVDSTEMDLLAKEMTASLEGSFKMYYETGFKGVVLTIPKNVTMSLQMNRLMRNAGLTNGKVEQVR